VVKAAPGEPGFNSHCYPYESLVVTGIASAKIAPVHQQKSYLLVGTSEPWNKGVSNIKFR